MHSRGTAAGRDGQSLVNCRSATIWRSLPSTVTLGTCPPTRVESLFKPTRRHSASLLSTVHVCERWMAGANEPMVPGKERALMERMHVRRNDWWRAESGQRTADNGGRRPLPLPLLGRDLIDQICGRSTRRA